MLRHFVILQPQYNAEMELNRQTAHPTPTHTHTHTLPTHFYAKQF